MTTYHEFSQEDIQHIIDAGQAHHDSVNLRAMGPSDAMLHASPLVLGETCISVTVENHSVCLNLPIIDKKICFPIPVSVPNGTAAKACLKICTTIGIPTGVCVTISALGMQIVHQCFGKC